MINRVISAYTPSNTDPLTRERIFVQRHKLLERVVRWCEESMLTGNKHHLLFIGPRGSGKTHLVSMAQDRLLQNPNLADKMRIAWLGEDSVFTGLIDVALEIADELANEYPDEFGFDYRAHAGSLAADEAAESILDEVIRRLGEKSILLIMENLDRAFHGLRDLGQKKWRAFLQETGRIATLATSQQLFEDISSRDAAFYGFFEVIHLQSLSVDDARQLMANIAKEHNNTKLLQFMATPEGRYRVRALHHLAGGNHRMYVMLSEFLTKESLDGLVAAFEELAEGLTPYFQERVRSLSPQQARIVQSLCNSTGAMTVKQVAEDTFISDRNVSKQLGELKQKGYVVSEKRGKESYYEMAEPLMRLCLEVKKQRGKPLRLIADFLRAWFSAAAIRQELDLLSGVSRSGPRVTEYQQVALNSDCAFLKVIAQKLDREFESRIEAKDFLNAMKLAEELEHSNRPTGLTRKSRVLKEQGHLAESLEEINKVLTSPDLTADQKADALLSRGEIFGELGESEKAIDDYSAVVEMMDVTDSLKARALINRVIENSQLDKSDKVIADISTVFEIADVSIDARTLLLVHRGKTFNELGEFEKAIADCSQVVEMPESQEFFKTSAQLERGGAYILFGEYDKAIADYSAVIETKCAKVDQKAQALVYRGAIYCRLGERERGVADFSTAIQMKDAPVDQKVAALLHRGVTQLKLAEWEKAIADCSAVIVMEEASADQRAQALLSRAMAHLSTGESDKATVDYSAVIEMKDTSVDTQAAVVFERGVIALHVNQFELALDQFTSVLEMSDVSPWLKTLALFRTPVAMIPTKPVHESIASVRSAFELGDSNTDQYGGSPSDILKMILRREHSSWSEFVEKLVPVYARYNWLSSLASGLTESIEVLDEGGYSESQLDSWNSAWQKFREIYDELSIPLGALDAAVQVIKTGKDRPLFKLPIEIRKIVRPLLKNSLSEN